MSTSARQRNAATNGVRKRGGGRERILAAALEQFAEFGFDKTSTVEIARAADIAQSVVLYHFETKDELWQEAMRELFRSVDAKAVFRNDIYADLSPVDRFRIMLRQFVISCALHPELGRIIFREGLNGGPRLEWLVRELALPHYEAFFNLINELAEAGHIDAVHPVVATLAIHGAAATIFNLSHLREQLMPEQHGREALVEMQTELLMRLFTRGLLREQT